ncbi:hypothetical protein N665_0268s0056 [Sinapis alba]|nr:hypothetical protein N665_0268s0056 [Sinapis alba]
MSTKKIQFIFLLFIFLIASYHFSQSFAGCKYQGYCKTNNDCKKICRGHDIDPSFLACILSPPKENQCCCLTRK